MSRVYVSDLDHTLLRPDATLSDFARSTLVSLLERGVHFTVASARAIASMQPILEGVPIRLPVVEFSGAFVTDLATGEHLVTNSLTEDLAGGVLELALDCGGGVAVSTFDGKADRLYLRPEPANDGMAWHLNKRRRAHDPRLVETDDLHRGLDDDVVCITTVGRRDDMLALSEQMEQAFGNAVQMHFFENFYSPGWHWVTVHHESATKGRGVQTVLEIGGLGDHEVVVFGDSATDAAMFEIADRAVAVENATDDLKALASHVIGPYHEDSVAHFLLADAPG